MALFGQAKFGGCQIRQRSMRDSCSLRRHGCIRQAVRPMKTEDRRICPNCGNEFSASNGILSGVHATQGTREWSRIR